jgi:hypothetical protein
MMTRLSINLSELGCFIFSAEQHRQENTHIDGETPLLVSCMCCAFHVYLLLVAALSIQRVVFLPTSVVPLRFVHSDFEKGGLPKEPPFALSTADHLANVHCLAGRSTWAQAVLPIVMEPLSSRDTQPSSWKCGSS